MGIEQIILIIIFVILVVLSAVISCADMAYGVCNQLRLKKEADNGNKNSGRALFLAEHYDKTITTILFTNNLTNIGASSIVTILCAFYFPNNEIATTISAIILLLFLLIFCELTPKILGRIYADKFAKALVNLMGFLKIIFFPFVYVTTKLAWLITLPIMKKAEENDEEEETVTDDELHEMVDTIEEEGVIDESQGELLRSAIDFKETEAHEIMTPRIDMFAFDIKDDIEELIHSEEIFSHSRVPVYDDSIDNIIGILPTKVLLKSILKKEKIDIRAMLLPVTYVPRSQKLSSILKDFKSTETHIAIVIDEYGGTEGLLTMEDILEELVGDIWDETDEIKEDVIKEGENKYLISGSMNIEDFFELVDLDFEDTDSESSTVGGWVIEKLERFAHKWDKFDYENINVLVTKVSEFTVEQIKVTINQKIKKDDE